MGSDPAMGTRVQVGIPWREEPSRLEAFYRVRDWYESHGLEVVAAESPRHRNGPFNIAAARNHLVRNLLTSDVMVLSDGDTLPQVEPLLEALAGALADNLVHLPYHLYRDDTGVYTPGACSGVLVTTRDGWEATNGQDERFRGWGYEDSAWKLAHLTLSGPIMRHRGTVTAATHSLAPRSTLAANHALFRQYQAAYGQVDRMTQLVNGAIVALSPQNQRAAAAREANARRRFSSRPHGA